MQSFLSKADQFSEGLLCTPWGCQTTKARGVQGDLTLVYAEDGKKQQMFDCEYKFEGVNYELYCVIISFLLISSLKIIIIFVAASSFDSGVWTDQSYQHMPTTPTLHFRYCFYKGKFESTTVLIISKLSIA